MTVDVFGDPPQNDNVDVSTLVGEDKKYKTPDDLAKAYVNADNHLDELRRDNALLKAERDALKNQTPTPKEQEPAHQQTPDTPKPQSDEDRRSQIREELKAITDEQRFEQNVEATAQKLIEVYGDGPKANEAVQRRAKELGVGVQWLRDTAARSPSAFYASMGMNPNERPGNRETPAPRNEMRTDVNLNRNPSGNRNYAFYNEIKKSDKSRYYSVAVQSEMQKAARVMGDSFYT